MVPYIVPCCVILVSFVEFIWPCASPRSHSAHLCIGGSKMKWNCNVLVSAQANRKYTWVYSFHLHCYYLQLIWKSFCLACDCFCFLNVLLHDIFKAKYMLCCWSFMVVSFNTLDWWFLQTQVFCCAFVMRIRENVCETWSITTTTRCAT